MPIQKSAAGSKEPVAGLFQDWLTRRHLEIDGDPVLTETGALLPVQQAGKPAMLKLLSDEDEKQGAALLSWWAGTGAAEVLALEDDALLMERACGTRSLMALSSAGRDAEAIDILCDAANALHRKRPAPPPQTLTPLESRFGALFENASAIGGILPPCAELASDLLASQTDIRPLHGDIHHDNVMDFGPRGFLAIDPKGLAGERGFDFCNIFCNPDLAAHSLSIARNADCFDRRLKQITVRANLNQHRLLRWIAAFGGLSATWFMQNEDKRSEISLSIAQLALSRLTW